MVIRYAPARPAPPAGGRMQAPPTYRGGDILPFSIRILETITLAKARLRRRALPMMLAAALPLAGAVGFVWLQTPVYRTTATVFVDPQAGQPGRPATAADAAALSGQLRLATSRTVLQKAIEQGKLTESAGLKGPDGFLARLFGLALRVAGQDSGATSGKTGDLVSVLARSAGASAGDGVNLIEISGKATDAGAAAAIANAVAQAFVDEIVASAEASSGSERARRERRGEDFKARLDTAEQALARFRAANGLEASAARLPAGASSAVSELARARLAASDARARYEQLQKLLSSGREPEVVADLARLPSLERLKAQYNDAAAQEISFRSSLGPRHPAYLEMQQQAREKKRLLQEGLRLALSAARIDWQTARDQEMAAEKQPGAEAATPAAPLPPPTRLRELERDVEIARAGFERSLRALGATESEGQGAAARIVAPAAAPLSPVSEGRMALFAGALTLSLLLAIATGLKRGARPPRPDAQRPERPLRRTVQTVRPAPVDVSGPSPSQVNPRPKAPPPPVARMPAAAAPSLSLHGIDALADELAQASGEFVLQTVLASAVAPGEAKSDAALALARAAQARQLRVLVIDADDSDGGLSDRFGGGAIAGTIPIQGRARPLLVAEGGAQRICLVPCESKAPSPPDLATLPALTGIAGNFDLVIIDGPVLSGTLSERKLARAAQVVMLACPAAAMPGLTRISQLLGVSPEVLRVVQPMDTPANPLDAAPVAGRPMGVVRLRKVA